MCVSLLERVKQGKSNIILILILSARSQDRDQQGSAKRLLLNYFNPLGRKTETLPRNISTINQRIFQSTRSQDRDINWKDVIKNFRNFNPLGRKTETIYRRSAAGGAGISIHSVARPRLLHVQLLLEGCPFQSTRSQDRDPGMYLQARAWQYFNPLGRKTETRSSSASICAM